MARHIRGQRLLVCDQSVPAGHRIQIDDNWSACGQTNNSDLLVSRNRNDLDRAVTCKRCRKTQTFKEASA